MGAPYDRIDGSQLALTEEPQPYTWSPARGFIPGEAIDDDRTENARGDYVEGGSLFTTTPQRFGVRPDGRGARGASAGAAPASPQDGVIEGGPGCSQLLQLARTGRFGELEACVKEALSEP